MGLSGSFALPVLRTVSRRGSCRAVIGSVFNLWFGRGSIKRQTAEDGAQRELRPTGPTDGL